MASMILALVTLVALVASASETMLSGVQGHQRTRLPLAVWIQATGDADLDAAARRALDDWNALTREVLGLDVFVGGAAAETAHIRVSFEPPATRGMMGATHLATDDVGTIQVPISITVIEPVARGQTSRETVLYQVLAHEFGHALGLPHVRDPGALMCCPPESIDFNDPATRAAYVQARRQPDVRTARSQLADHYERFWRR